MHKHLLHPCESFAKGLFSIIVIRAHNKGLNYSHQFRDLFLHGYRVAFSIVMHRLHYLSEFQRNPHSMHYVIQKLLRFGAFAD